ncbi:DUF1700 domain-containing protein [Breznakia pachnodae]|uniref:Membrane protein n=1 Tax=Breznakia pachnodae TaxID=265178 RepID=A0ABU0DZA3_9FIRM|nr:DUF1700 domain-containing protein [Breznakia pachnodae]MDQ0359964.1 putative membrane protein [Breznakia pachnodae]
MKEMSKKEYIADLSYHLRDLQREEFEDAIHYVEEYFEEAGEDNASQVIEELGPPNKLAATIRAESTIKNNQQQQERRRKREDANNREDYVPRSGKRDLKSLWIIILGIFALPIALPLALAAFLIVFVFFLVIFCLIIAGICCMIALIIFSVPAFVSSLALMSTSYASGLVGLGISFISLGAGLLILTALILAIRTFIPWAVHCLSGLFQRFSRRKSYSV